MVAHESRMKSAEKAGKRSKLKVPLDGFAISVVFCPVSNFWGSIAVYLLNCIQCSVSMVIQLAQKAAVGDCNGLEEEPGHEMVKERGRKRAVNASVQTALDFVLVEPHPF